MSYQDDLEKFMRQQAAAREAIVLQTDFERTQVRRRWFAAIALVGGIVGAVIITTSSAVMGLPDLPPGSTVGKREQAFLVNLRTTPSCDPKLPTCAAAKH